MTEPTTPSKRHVGWYPDPEGEAPLRWWDGTAWTGHTRDSYPVAGPASGPVPPPRLPFGAARWALVGQVVAFAVAEVPILLLHLTLRAVNIGEVVGFYLILYGILFVTCRTGAQRFGNGDLRRDLGFELRWRDSYRGFGVY
ncbi:MAG TPA: DUF2510 domain-containing protein, partial [Acidimicrobiales bacterium]